MSDAVSALDLMRARYEAYASGDTDFLRRTWHPNSVPDDLAPDPAIEWVGLEIVRTERGGALDADGIVEFKAHYRRHHDDGRTDLHVLHEVSRFERVGMRWRYVDGVHPL